MCVYVHMYIVGRLLVEVDASIGSRTRRGIYQLASPGPPLGSHPGGFCADMLNYVVRGGLRLLSLNDGGSPRDACTLPRCNGGRGHGRAGEATLAARFCRAVVSSPVWFSASLRAVSRRLEVVRGLGWEGASDDFFVSHSEQLNVLRARAVDRPIMSTSGS